MKRPFYTAWTQYLRVNIPNLPLEKLQIVWRSYTSFNFCAAWIRRGIIESSDESCRCVTIFKQDLFEGFIPCERIHHFTVWVILEWEWGSFWVMQGLRVGMFFLRYSCHRNNPNKWNRGRTSRHDPYFYQDMQMQGCTLPMGLQNNPHHMTPAHMMYAYPPARYNAIQWQQGCPYSYHYPNSTSCADNIEYEVCFLIKGVTSFFKKVFGIDKKKEFWTKPSEKPKCLLSWTWNASSTSVPVQRYCTWFSNRIFDSVDL